MRTCTVCEKIKDEQDYFYKNKKAHKLHAQCKQCYVEKRRATYRAHYQSKGSEYRERALIRNRRLKDLLRAKMADYLSGKSCVACGNNDPRVLDFDHIDPATKSFGIAKGLHAIKSWGAILQEVDKCQILCANCHRIRTSEQQGWYRVTTDLS